MKKKIASVLREILSSPGALRCALERRPDVLVLDGFQTVSLNEQDIRYCIAPYILRNSSASVSSVMYDEFRLNHSVTESIVQGLIQNRLVDSGDARAATRQAEAAVTTALRTHFTWVLDNPDCCSAINIYAQGHKQLSVIRERTRLTTDLGYSEFAHSLMSWIENAALSLPPAIRRHYTQIIVDTRSSIQSHLREFKVCFQNLYPYISDNIPPICKPKRALINIMSGLSRISADDANTTIDIATNSALQTIQDCTNVGAPHEFAFDLAFAVFRDRVLDDLTLRVLRRRTVLP